MDCAGLVFCVMMIVIWLDEAGFFKWLRKKLKYRREICLIFLHSNITKFGMLTHRCRVGNDIALCHCTDVDAIRVIIYSETNGAVSKGGTPQTPPSEEQKPEKQQLNFLGKPHNENRRG